MNYLFYVGPGIGDIVMMLEVAKTIKNTEYNANIDCFMNQPNGYNRHGITNNVMQYQTIFRKLYYYSSKEILHDLKLIVELKKNKYEKGFVFQYGHTTKVSKIPAMIINLLGVQSIGFNYKNNLCKKKYEYDKNETIVCRCLEVMKKEGYEIIDRNDVLDKKKIENEKLKVELNSDKKSVGLCIGSGLIGLKINGNNYTSVAKNWNINNWINLANQLVERNYDVVLLGSESEKKLMVEVSSKIEKRVINAVSKCSLGESMRLIYSLDMVIGGDTGLMHIAASLGKKTLSLFGCTSPIDYLPFGKNSYYIFKNYDCSPCIGRKESIFCQKHKCMDDIGVQEVIRKSMEIL